MNEELTDELLEAMKKCDGACFKCSAKEYCAKAHITSSRQELATALLEERAKPKDDVWKFASLQSDRAAVNYYENGKLWGTREFTRELPKTRARKYAENLYRKLSFERISDNQSIDAIEELLNKYAEELTSIKETN